MKRFAKLGVFTVVSLCLVAVLAFSAMAAELTDIKNHWAKEYIEYGVEKGYIGGYQDGTFLPDKTVTRAEFSKMLNNAIKLTATGTAKADFSDVKSTDWYFNEVKKAENAGYIAGYDDKTFRPGNSVSRQEAAVMLSRIVIPTTERANIKTFGDGTTVDSWAVDAVTMIAAKGYIKGDEKGNFNPKGALTRAQAAKLICEFVKNENVVNKNKIVEVTEKDLVFSETLFTDDIIIDYSGKEALTITFKDCRVVGNINIKADGAVVTFENAKAKSVTIDGEEISVSLDKASSVKTTYVKYPAELTGSGFESIVISGEEVSAGTVEITGNCDNIEVESDAYISADGVKKLNVTKKANLVIQSGEIDSLTVESGAKGSTINLSKKVVVANAHNKAAVSYIGSGTIEVANNTVSGVEFDEGVTVKKTTGKTDSESASKDEGFFSGVTVSPTKGKTGVAPSSNIVFNFEKAVLNNKGEELKVAYIEDEFELRSTSATSGTKVGFEATISSSQKKITINPVNSLVQGRKYYVVIPAGVITYEDGTKNEKYETYFTIASLDDEEEEGSSGSDEDDEKASVTMSPKNGADDVSVNTSIKLTFSGTLKAYSGTLDEEYIEDEAIEIHEGSKDGDTVKFSATISGKTITLTPSRLLGETTYYVVILGSKIKVDGSTLSKTTLSFTTEEGTAITITPGNGETGVSLKPEITVSFAEPMLQMNGEDRLTENYIKNEVLYFKMGSTKESAEDVYYNVTSIAENNRSFTIALDEEKNEELEAGTTYYIIIEEGSLVGETTESENAKVTTSFKTATAMAPMFTPYDGKQNVAVGSEIRISFSDTLLIYSTKKEERVEVDDAYLDTLINGYEDSKGKIVGKNRITLKRVGDSSSKTLSITATIDSDGKTIIITPDEALLAEKKYTLSIEKNLFYSYDGKTYKASSAGSATFNTNIAMSPTVTPKNEAKDVALTVKPVITFNEMIYNAESQELKDLKALYVKNNVIEFVDQNGDAVEFDVDVEVSGSKSTITIIPEEDLEGNYEYTITINDGKLQNEDGITNSEKIVTFTTKVSNTITVTPDNKDTMVSPNAIPTVKFGTAMLTADGEPVDAEYAAEHIFLTEEVKSTDAGDAVPAEVTSEDGRTFTIVPRDGLETGTKYYVNVIEKAFLYEDEETKNKGVNYYFTTIPEPELTKCTAAANNKTSIKITYTSNVYDSSEDKLAKLVVEGGPETKEFNITAKSSTVTISRLETNTEYTFTVYVVYDGEFESEHKEVTVKTKS